MNQGWLLLRPCLRPLSKRPWVMLRLDTASLVCEPLRGLRKAHNMNQDRLHVWKSHWKQLGWAHKLDGVASQEITTAGQTLLARLMETQIGHLPMSVGSALQRNNGFCQHLCLRESYPCSPYLETSSSLYVPGTFWAAAPVLELRASEFVIK